MSSQSGLQSVRVVIIAGLGDRKAVDIIAMILQQEFGKESRIISVTDKEFFQNPVNVVDNNEVVVFAVRHSIDELQITHQYARTRNIQPIGVLLGDISSNALLQAIPALQPDSIIDFRRTDEWKLQTEVLNSLIDRLAERRNIDENQPQNLPPGTVSLTLTSDNGRTEATYIVSTSVIHLLLAATHIKTVTANDTSGPEIEFTSLLAAYAQTRTALSHWFRNFIERTQSAIPQVDTTIPQDIYTETAGNLVVFASSSVRNLFAAVKQLFGDGSIDEHHLMAAYIYEPGGHISHYQTWKLDQKAWSASFLGYIQRFHHDVFELYSSEHARAFSEVPIPDVQDNPVGDIGAGPSTHITPDIWTTEDELDYRPYAYAIARFLTHPRTAAPLTISIQAPWGGGKTSLMRMIQRELDAPATQPAIVSKDAPREPNALHMKVRDVLREIEKKLTPHTVVPDPDKDKRNESRFKTPPEPLPAKPGDSKEPLQPKMTVWFNVWKYESINQVWAGLVDAILRQVTERMTPFEREKFWLQLTFKRVDADKIRQTIYERILRYLWQYSRKILFWGGGVFAGALLLALVNWFWAGIAMSGTVLTTLTLVWSKYKKASKDVKDEPADISLREYVSAPDYTAELGFVHYAETDFRKLLACIPEQYKPLVIFIDDLDRCSPLRVAQVMEAINLFLAGEFPDCMFVLGMDSEMVAAALQAAHSEVIHHLPSDASIPVGWRFMEKFIQLPFIIPPSGTTNIKRYTASLFAEKKQEPDAAVHQKVGEILLAQSSRGYREDEIRREMRQSGLNDGQAEQVVAQVRVQTALKKIDEGIKNFNDSKTQIEIETLLGREMEIFRGNPRDLKRFVNTFRFHYFLWWAQSARMSREIEAASLEQVVRWTAFSIRWPEVVRWLWRGSDTHRQRTEGSTGSGQDEKRTASRMKQLEDTCLDIDGSGQWENAIRQTVFPGNDKNETDKDVHWLHDRELYSFLRREIDRDEGERLSSAVGKGLW